ncbi:MAG: hypothetical protein ACW9W4_05615 [Candidatus Nitrosopumilus sp. bin_7KS]
MKKISFLGIGLLIVGLGFTFLSIISFVEIQASIEYFKTLPVGSSQPMLDYPRLYNFIIISIILIPSGIAVYLKTNH